MMNGNNDFYKILQVHPEAAQEVIDAAYRCLSKKYHPDLNNNHHKATEHMKEINVAYSVVGNPRGRRLYHFDWIKQNAGDKSKNAFTSNFNKNEKKENESDLQNEESEAYEVLDDFFAETINENWEKAYEKLTQKDRENVPGFDFIEWKEVVTQIYKLGGYKISFFKRYLNCEYAGIIYPTILQFSVALKEMTVSNSQMCEEHTQKYVAFDGHDWRVCLGFKDLKSNILKFKHLAQAMPKIDRDDVFLRAIEKIDLLTGLYSLNGFIEQAEREIARSKRYGNPLSLAILKIEEPVEASFQETSASLEASISSFAEAICEKMRRTDIIGRCGDRFFAIAFTETTLSDANQALEKILDQLESDKYSSHKIYSACVPLIDTNIGHIIEDTFTKVQLREEKSQVTKKAKEMPEDKGKLGKYKISDILGFNKKGRNHF
jgi:GGDEF domain-containing protein